MPSVDDDDDDKATRTVFFYYYGIPAERGKCERHYIVVVRVVWKIYSNLKC